MNYELFQSPFLSALGGLFLGIAGAWLTQQILNKRGTLSYTVT